MALRVKFSRHPNAFYNMFFHSPKIDRARPNLQNATGTDSQSTLKNPEAATLKIK